MLRARVSFIMSTKLGLVDMTITECSVLRACMLHALLESHVSAHALLGHRQHHLVR